MTEPTEELKILLLEDSEDDAGLIAHALKREGLRFHLKRVDTREEFEEAMDGYQPNVILSDHALPSFNSLEAYRLFRTRNMAVPFILVTGTVSEEFAVNVLRQGVDDYILKTNLSRLPASIQGAMNKHKALVDKIHADERLRRQYQELVKVNTELDHFVYSVSHNLRGPLLSVLGVINLLKKESSLNELQSKYLDMLLDCVKRLDTTMMEILHYSQNNHNEVQREVVNLENLVARCYNELAHLPASRIIKKSFSYESKKTLYTDPQRLFIVLKNVIANALAYCDPSKTENWIVVAANIEDDLATITIEDNGIGIESKILPDVFKMFFRGTERSHGAGLGLYIAREIMQRLNGTIRVESIAGKGTTVHLNFPNH